MYKVKAAGEGGRGGRVGKGAEVNRFDDDVVALMLITETKESNFNPELAADRNWSLVKILGGGAEVNLFDDHFVA